MSISVEPIIIEVPGIPGKLRSQTLDEYMSALQSDHPARKELQQLRELALEGMKSMNEMVTLVRENLALKDKIAQLEKASGLAIRAEDIAVEAGIASAPPESPFKCSVCGKVTASAWGLNRHMVSKHPKPQ